MSLVRIGNSCSYDEVQECLRCGLTKKVGQIKKHNWGTFDYSFSHEACHYYGDKTCKDCGELDRKGPYEMHLHFDYDDGCTVGRRCQCGKSEKVTVNHDFGAWKVSSDSPCADERQCAKCSKTERREVKERHDWPDWELAPTECSESKVCSKCSFTQEREVDHAWGEWRDSSLEPCGKERSCTRCGSIEQSSLEHSWSDWTTPYPDYPCSAARMCNTCRALENKEVHVWKEIRMNRSGYKVCQVCGMTGGHWERDVPSLLIK